MRSTSRITKALQALVDAGFSAGLPVVRQIILVIIRYALCDFAFFDELFSSGHTHAAAGDLSGHLDLSCAGRVGMTAFASPYHSEISVV